MKNWKSAVSGLAGAFIALAISRSLGLSTIPEIILLLVCIGIGNSLGAMTGRK
ncbi:unannotated protein [freshwater metagenome]|uniref:Unannotated protein n=1 Tax=freshwater metagenome TaxID=449393 RepID=A0A6J7GX81_9ZZZZ|nr:hypothetical protein [Actinomycetota bacterium]MSW62205.1 hypothetical protein [Actinomycetota bacterium]MSX89284.1 hypothetical protein [Actinomycetota bacterium]MTA57751.1 hypothetical protein [Actinomycetota bacterium]